MEQLLIPSLRATKLHELEVLAGHKKGLLTIVWAALWILDEENRLIKARIQEYEASIIEQKNEDKPKEVATIEGKLFQERERESLNRRTIANLLKIVEEATGTFALIQHEMSSIVRKVYNL